MANLPFRFAPLPRSWPGRQRPHGWKPTPSKFKSHTWSRIQKEILAELSHLKAKDIVLHIDLVGPGNLRDDGMLRADAKPVSSRVILSFTRGDQGMKLTFPCDTFSYWEDNVWAVRLTLENLRAIDRYGVTQGDQQYVGFTALPAGNGKKEMSYDDAIEILAEHGELAGIDLLTAPAWLVDTIQKRARASAHPDAGGSTEGFQRVDEAIALITSLRAR